MSVFVTVETREVVFASLPLRAICACCTEDYCPRLEEVFYSKLALKLDYE